MVGWGRVFHGTTFTGCVQLATQNLTPVLVYFVINYRGPHLIHFWAMKREPFVKNVKNSTNCTVTPFYHSSFVCKSILARSFLPRNLTDVHSGLYCLWLMASYIELGFLIVICCCLVYIVYLSELGIGKLFDCSPQCHNFHNPAECHARA